MQYLGDVSAEGGPLILIGSKIASHWHGAAGEEPTDYDRGCDLFDKEPSPEGAFVDVGPGTALLWEMNGAGTASVFTEENTWTIIRSWLSADVIDSGRERDALFALASTPTGNKADLGALFLPEDTLLLLWSTEDASSISTSGAPGDVPAGNFFVEGSAIVLGNVCGRYGCLHDHVKSELGEARRLTIRKKNE